MALKAKADFITTQLELDPELKLLEIASTAETYLGMQTNPHLSVKSRIEEICRRIGSPPQILQCDQADAAVSLHGSASTGGYSEDVSTNVLLADARLRDNAARIGTAHAPETKAIQHSTAHHADPQLFNTEANLGVVSSPIVDQEPRAAKPGRTDPEAVPSKQELRIAVIGMAGQGKSTFLNGLVDSSGETSDLFKVSPGSAACTQNMQKETFEVRHGGDVLKITAVDTMGFPDPDPCKAVKFFDAVIKECNKDLNAIVWMHKSSELSYQRLKCMKILMQEFNKSNAPIIFIMNGVQNYCRLASDDRTIAKRKDYQKLCSSTSHVVETCGVAVAATIIGVEKDDLLEGTRDSLLAFLRKTTPKASKLRTASELVTAYDALRTQKERLDYEKQNRQEMLEKAERDQAWARTATDTAQIGATVVGVLSAPVACIPVAGPYLSLFCMEAAASMAVASGVAEDYAVSATASWVEASESFRKVSEDHAVLSEMAQQTEMQVNEIKTYLRV